MKKYLYGAIALIAALAVACKEETIPDEDNEASAAGLSIPVELSPLGSLQPLWSEGDKISVFTQKGATAAFSLSSKAGKASALFSGELEDLEEGDSVFVVHPFVDGAVRTAVPIDLSQQKSSVGVIAPADITVAKGKVTEGPNAPSLTLEHILGGLVFSVDNKNIIAQPVTSAGIIGDGLILKGNYNLSSSRLSTDNPERGRSVISLQGENAAPRERASWVLSVIPQTLPEGSKAFLEIAPGDTLFKSLSRAIIKAGKLLELSFEIEFEGLNVSSVIEPFVSATDNSESIDMVWYASDKFGVFSGEKNSNVPFSLVSGENASEALFLGYPDVLEGDALQAYYPYSGAAGADGTIDIDLTTQTIRPNGAFAPMDIAVAQASVGQETAMAFKHVLGGILVEITNTSESNSLIANRITISSDNIALKGSYNVISGELTIDAPSAAESVCETGRAVLGGATELFFFSVPPQEIAAGTRIEIETSTGKIIEASIPEAVAIGAGEYIKISIEDEGERVGILKDLGSCQYDTEGTVMWTSPALSLDGKVAYVTSSNYKIAAIELVQDGEELSLSSTPSWVCDAKVAGMVSGGNNITSTPAVSSTGIYALLGKGAYASLVKVLPDGTLDYYRWASYYYSGSTSSPDPAATSFEFDMECPIIFPTSDVYAERIMFSMQANGDYKRFVSARGCGNPSGDDNTKIGGSRQTSKGTTTNLGGILGYVGSDGWYFLAGRTGSSAVGAQVIKTNTSGGSMSGDSSLEHLIGYIEASGTSSNGRGCQMSQDASFVYYTGWNSDQENYPGGNTLLFRYSKSNIQPSSSIKPDYIVALPGGVSTTSSSGMRGVGSVLSADGSVLYVTTCETSDESAYVHAVNTSDGSIKWSYEAEKIYGVAAVDDLGNVYFNDYGSGELIQLDPKTGVALEKIPLGTVQSSPTIGPGGIIYCNTRNEAGCPTLRAFSISGSIGPARGWSQLGGNPQKSGTAY